MLVWLVGCVTGKAVLLPGDGVPGPWAPTLSVVDRASDVGYQDYAFHASFKRGRSCSIADFDSDGNLDIFVGNPFDTSYLLRNVGTDGAPQFEAAAPILEGEFPWSAPAADYDRDGDTDLFLSTGGIEAPGFDLLLRNDLVETGIYKFTDVTDVAGVAGGASPLTGEPLPAMSVGAQWVDLDRDGDLDLHVDTGVYPSLLVEAPPGSSVARTLVWRNDDGVFTDITNSIGLSLQGLGRFSIWFDYDLDGDLDLYQNHFASTPQTLWRNDLVETGTLGFTDVSGAMSLGPDTDVSMPLEVFSSSTADVNNDGWPDVVQFVRGVPDQGPYGEGHVLLINVAGTGFVAVQDIAGLDVGAPPSPLRDHTDAGVMGSSVVDATGDGLPDVYVGNGGPATGNRDQWFVARELIEVELEGVGVVVVPIYEDRSDLVDFPAAVSEGPPDAYPPYPYRTHAVCIADIDRDGFVDIAVTNGGMFLIGGDAAKEPNRLFQVVVEPRPHFIRARMVGDDFGARVTVRAVDAAGEDFQVVRFHWSREGFGASNGPELFFGLRDAVGKVEVEVRWSDGTIEDLGSVQLDSDLIVTRR